MKAFFFMPCINTFKQVKTDIILSSKSYEACGGRDVLWKLYQNCIIFLST